MRRLGLCVAVTLLTVIPLTGCDSRDASPTSSVDPAHATVVRVIDGDTVEVSIGGHDETVRLLGIDTPETVKPDSPVECYGPEASATTKSLLPEGTGVRLVRDVEPRDGYGRLLAYVYRTSDELFVNLRLVEVGAAEPFPFEPNTTFAASIVAAAVAAEAAGLGLWSACGT